MAITHREIPGNPIETGANRYTPVAGDTTATMRFPGGRYQAGYARPLRIDVENGVGKIHIPIPDRQLQIVLTALVVAVLARLIERRRPE